MDWKRAFLLGVTLMVFATGCSSKKTIIQGAGGGNLPNNGFPKGVNVQDVTNGIDPARDWGFYTGEEAGRHDPFVDLRQLWAGTATLGGPSLATVEDGFACGPASGTLVICPDSRPIPEGSNVGFFSMNLGARVPLENTSPEDSGRYSLFFDLGPNPETESTAPPDGPDLASQSADLIYQLVFGAPGGPSTGVDPDSIELSVLDYRTDTFPETRARVWLHGRFVTWMVPLSEIQGAVGVRGGAFWGNALDQGDPALGNADVVPGGVHAPYGFLPLEGLPLQETAPEEAAAEFVDDLSAAIRSGIQDYLAGRLHPAVIDRYGEEACRAHVGSLRDPTRAYEVRTVSDPGPWDYASDGQSVVIPDAITIDTRATVEGETSPEELHVAPAADDQLAWFTDCGDPID